MRFAIEGTDVELEIFTTRADTVFGVTFMVLAPESEYVDIVTTADQKAAVDAYRDSIKHKTERERMIDKKVSGVFSGAYAVNPLSGKKIPVWISDYVLAGYGTGAIMAVPAHDSRDYAFARHFELPIIPLIEGADVSEMSFDAKSGKMINSCGPELDLNGLEVAEAIAKTKEFIEEKGIGRVKVNYRLRDAIFSRQRYWGKSVLSRIFAGGEEDSSGGGLLRKAAHFTEFAALGMCLAWLHGMLEKGKLRPFLWGVLAASVDETIQRFVPDRGPSVKDVCIDSAGVLAGIILLWIGHDYFQKRSTKLSLEDM